MSNQVGQEDPVGMYGEGDTGPDERAEIVRETLQDRSNRTVEEEIGCPALVLKSDAETERRIQDLDIADALANGRLVHIHGSDHYVFQTEYEAAYAELRTFLNRL